MGKTGFMHLQMILQVVVNSVKLSIGRADNFEDTVGGLEKDEASVLF